VPYAIRMVTPAAWDAQPINEIESWGAEGPWWRFQNGGCCCAELRGHDPSRSDHPGHTERAGGCGRHIAGASYETPTSAFEPLIVLRAMGN
jgi:hypothetical protein